MWGGRRPRAGELGKVSGSDLSDPRCPLGQPQLRTSSGPGRISQSRSAIHGNVSTPPPRPEKADGSGLGQDAPFQGHSAGTNPLQQSLVYSCTSPQSHYCPTPLGSSWGLRAVLSPCRAGESPEQGLGMSEPRGCKGDPPHPSPACSVCWERDLNSVQTLPFQNWAQGTKS